MLGQDNDKQTVGDVEEKLQEGEMSAEDAALYGATLAQEAYREGELSRGEFQKYLDQAEQATLDGYDNVELPDVDAAVEPITAVDEIHDSQQQYDKTREWVSGYEDLEGADLVVIPGPQNIRAGANVADELGLDYAVMVSQDEETETIGPNADEDSTVEVEYRSGTYDVELHGDAESLEGKNTVVAGSTWGRNMTEADSFTDAPKRNSEKMFSAVEQDGAIREWGGEWKSLTETFREKLGF